jgi:hypothetical protein
MNEKREKRIKSNSDPIRYYWLLFYNFWSDTLQIRSVNTRQNLVFSRSGSTYFFLYQMENSPKKN